jgi:hypothetical protein
VKQGNSTGSIPSNNKPMQPSNSSMLQPSKSQQADIFANLDPLGAIGNGNSASNNKNNNNNDLNPFQ